MRMWKNMADPKSPQITIQVLWHMQFACWINKATATHTEYVTLNDFPLQQWLYEAACFIDEAFLQ